MLIVIGKESANKFLAFVADPVLTFASGEHETEFEPFRNGIFACGETWGEALENIKSQINKYVNVYKIAMGGFPQFIQDGKAKIITEDVVVEDFLK